MPFAAKVKKPSAEKLAEKLAKKLAVKLAGSERRGFF